MNSSCPGRDSRVVVKQTILNARKWVLPFVAITVLAVAKPAFAVPILGDQLFYTGGMVTIEVLQKFAAFESDLSLYDSSVALQLEHIALPS